MAVTPSARGRGIGELLGRAAVERAKRLGAQRIELVSNTTLQPALGLYRKLGFTEAPLGPTKYQRANIRMILDLENSLKSVLILCAGLPVGLATNAAAVLALGLGHKVPCLRGSDPTDRSGEIHSGLTWLTLPVLQATAERLKAIRLEALSRRTMTMVDLPVVAQEARTEREYARALAELSADEVEYVGVGLFGERDTVTALSGTLSLLR
jgi:hypothetical protein